MVERIGPEGTGATFGFAKGVKAERSQFDPNVMRPAFSVQMSRFQFLDLLVFFQF
jgi:hypothetical protein